MRKKQGLRFLFFFYVNYHLPCFEYLQKRKEKIYGKSKHSHFGKRTGSHGATLLTVEEAENLSKETRAIGCWWWLRSSGYNSYSAACVNSDGSVIYYGHSVNLNFAVRPALDIQNLESSNLRIGDMFRFGNKDFKIISDIRALCTESIGKCAFREDWEADDANGYDTSDLKRFVDQWYQRSAFSCFSGNLFRNQLVAENLRKMYELSVAVLSEAGDDSNYPDNEKELLGECANIINLYENITGV